MSPFDHFEEYPSQLIIFAIFLINYPFSTIKLGICYNNNLYILYVHLNKNIKLSLVYWLQSQTLGSRYLVQCR